ncbi:glycosyl hydrolase family 28-related protein [Blastococcus sp. SYSU D00813]
MHLRNALTPSPRGSAARGTGPVVSRRSLLFLGAVGLASVPVAAAAPSTGPGLSLAGDEDEVLDARDFGARGNGTADDTRALQRLLDTSARRGAVAFVPAGTYRCTSGLLLRSDVQLQLDRRARLVKDWAAPPGMVDAFLRNADFAVKANRVRITGAGSIGARDHSRTGVVLALHGDDVEVSGITVDTYSGGQAVMYGGDRGRITGVTVRNSAEETGTGGIRVIGGTDFLGSDCHVESGDDCFQFVPIGNPEAEPSLYNQTISRGRFQGCTGTSSVSRFMVALLEFTGGDPGTTDMDASVVDCSFVDCHGAASNRGIVVKNTHSRGAIERVSFTDCTVDMTRAADASTQEIRVQTDPASRGAIRDVVFTRTHVLNPRNSTLRAGGPNISGLTFDACTLTAPSGAAPMTVVVDGTERPRFRGCDFTGAPGKRHVVAGPTTPVTDLAVEDCRFTGIDGAWAVDVLSAAGVRIAGSTFTAAAGSTTAKAIRTSPTTSGVVITGNDFTGIGNPTPITDRAVGTTLSSNRGL